MQADGVQVVTQKEIAAVLGLERQKQILGCADDSCSVELAGALGGDATMTGSVAKFGDSITLSVRVVGAKDAKVLAAYSDSAASEARIKDLVARAGASLVGDILRTLNRKAVVVGQGVRGTSRVPWMKLAWGSLILGLAGGGAGGYFYLSTQARYQNLVTAQHAAVGADPANYAALGKREQLYSAVGAGVAGVGVIAAVVFFVRNQAEPSAGLVFAPTPGGGALVFSGSLP